MNKNIKQPNAEELSLQFKMSHSDTKQFVTDQLEEQDSAKKVTSAVASMRNKYALGDRPLTAEDFYRICEGEDIKLAKTEVFRRFFYHSDVRGVLMRFPKTRQAVIYLRSFFDPEGIDLETAYHEIGHYFLHPTGQGLPVTPEFNFDLEAMDDKPEEETEADLFSRLCLESKR